MKIDFDRIASACAIFVAIVALVVAIYEARVTREHQEISVWPNLTRYNSSVSKVGDQKLNFAMYIKNNGIGPAVIKKVSFKLNGKDYERLTEIVSESIAPQKATNMIYADKTTIKVLLPGEERLLVGANFKDQQKKLFYSNAENNISITFCYCSLYNKCWELDDMNESKPIKSCN